MLYDLLKNGFGDLEDYNCSEKILFGANKAYNLGLDKKALRLSSGFGKGMAIEGLCGAVAASIMVLGTIYVEKVAHQSEEIKDLTKEFLEKYNQDMGDINCKYLRDKYQTEEYKCRNVILKAAEILDQIISRETR